MQIATPGHELALLQNYPNPFNPSTRIQYYLLGGGHTRLEVFDVLGRHVATIVDEVEPAGEHTVSVDGSRLPSGVYLYRLTTSRQALSRKMVILR